MTEQSPTDHDTLPFACCQHCECLPRERVGHDDTCRLCQCSCGNRYDGDNFCMVSACQWEGIEVDPDAFGAAGDLLRPRPSAPPAELP